MRDWEHGVQVYLKGDNKSPVRALSDAGMIQDTTLHEHSTGHFPCLSLMSPNPTYIPGVDYDAMAVLVAGTVNASSRLFAP